MGCLDHLIQSSPRVSAFGYSSTLAKGTFIVAWWYMLAGLLDEIRIVWALSTMTSADAQETFLSNLFFLVWLRPCTTPSLGVIEEITDIFSHRTGHGNSTMHKKPKEDVKEEEYDDDEPLDQLAINMMTGGICTGIVLVTTIFAIILLNGVNKVDNSLRISEAQTIVSHLNTVRAMFIRRRSRIKTDKDGYRRKKYR